VLGFFSFTEVTDPSAHEAYNAWHQLDHLPEQFTIEASTSVGAGAVPPLPGC